MDEFSASKLARTGGLIALTLVLTTLPADAQYPAVIPAHADAESDTPSEPAQPTPEKEKDTGGAGTPEQAQLVLPVALPTSHDARYVPNRHIGSGPADLAGDAFHACIHPSARTGWVCIEAVTTSLNAERCWLSCRDAHAPPISS